MLRKASEPAAHVAGFGWQLEGFGPPNLPKGFFDGPRPLKNAGFSTALFLSRSLGAAGRGGRILFGFLLIFYWFFLR